MPEPAPAPPPRGLRPWQKLALLLLLVASGLVASSYLFGKDFRDPRRLAARLDELVGSLGALAPAAFVGLQTIGPFLFLPAIPMAIAAGALFGPFWGAVWSLVGNVFGAVLSFLAGRHLGGEFVEKRARGKLLTIKSAIEGEGWRFVAFVRLVPLLPFGPLNMALGTTSISLRSYTITTALCMAPGAFVLSWLGHTGREAARGAENTLRNVGIAVGLLLLLSGIPAAARWARYRRDLEAVRAKRGDAG